MTTDPQEYRVYTTDGTTAANTGDTSSAGTDSASSAVASTTRAHRWAHGTGMVAAVAVAAFGTWTVMGSYLYGFPFEWRSTHPVFDDSSVPADFRDPIARAANGCHSALPYQEHAAVLAARLDALTGFDAATLVAAAPQPPAAAFPAEPSVAESVRLIAAADCGAALTAPDLPADPGERAAAIMSGPHCTAGPVLCTTADTTRRIVADARARFLREEPNRFHAVASVAPNEIP